MRVFQLNTFCGVKSTGRIACEIAKLVDRDGGECLIGYGVPGISEDSEPYAYRIGTPVERKIHAVIRKLLDAEGYGSWMATRQLIRKMEAKEQSTTTSKRKDTLIEPIAIDSDDETPTRHQPSRASKTRTKRKLIVSSSDEEGSSKSPSF